MQKKKCSKFVFPYRAVLPYRKNQKIMLFEISTKSINQSKKSEKTNRLYRRFRVSYLARYEIKKPWKPRKPRKSLRSGWQWFPWFPWFPSFLSICQFSLYVAYVLASWNLCVVAQSTISYITFLTLFCQKTTLKTIEDDLLLDNHVYKSVYVRTIMHFWCIACMLLCFLTPDIKQQNTAISQTIFDHSEFDHSQVF